MTNSYQDVEAHMTEPLNFALLGCGTVGGGVAKMLLEQRDRVAARAGRVLPLGRVVVRDPAKPGAVPLPRDLVSTDVPAAIADPNVQVVVELIGGTDVAPQAIVAGLAAGTHGGTPNNAPLAPHRAGRFAAAHRAHAPVAVEARRGRRGAAAG